MSDFERLPRHPWLDELLANPAQAVADLLSGRTDKFPYARLSDAEFLHQVLPDREDLEAERAALETALIGWLDARRRESWEVRVRHGLPVYIAALLEALNSVQMLGLKRAAYQLSEQHNTYLRWLEPLRLGTASDPALELWRCHALLPQDGHYLPYWMRFCVEAGGSRPATYLTVALQGLRELPTEQVNANLRYALHGLAQRYLARRDQSEARSEFKQYHATLRFSYPRAPKPWRDVWDEALAGLKPEQAAAVRALIDGKTDSKPDTRKTATPRLDPNRFAAESEALAKDINSGKVVAALWSRIEKLFNETLEYCRHSGDSFYFVRSLCRVGDLALKRTRTPEATAQALLTWLPAALEWERDNPHVWMLWAHCLDKLGAWDHCEWVYWEMRRYFPDDEHCRTELARLLLRQGREAEAAGLLREAAERFSDRMASHVEFARLLMRQGVQHYPEAEKWLREVAERHPDNAPSRLELARLHDLRGDKSAAIALLAAWNASHPGNKFVLDNLQRLHSGQDMALPHLGGEEGEPATPRPIAAPRPAVAPPAARPDALTQAAAQAARAAFRLSLQDAAGRAELETLLDADPDDQLVAFYLAWVDDLPQGYEVPPDAYALAMAGAWRAPAAADWEGLVQHFPLQRRLTWALRWLAGLRDGMALPDSDWQRLDKFAHADDHQPAPGEAIVVRLVREWGRSSSLPAAMLDARAQELIALTINRNLNPVAVTAY